MSGVLDAFDEFMGSWTEYADKPHSKSRKTPKRTTQYVGPGHTRVRYAHRTLDIRFRQTDKEFRAKQRARRRAGARKGAKNRTPRSRDNSVYVDYVDGQMVYVDSRGRDISLKSRGYADKGNDAIIKRNLTRDKYTVEEMRALLNDEHWEEEAGNKRWMYDSKATVKEFNKHKRSRGKR